ncbi:hypothetical protein DFH07DRAFT_780122 [Mycena maculata]|uniref:Uncharacterized protein n=1 Tax=Mycena maculata TaxID=230809 RepID=A0AAD7MXI0_9AGAR|nr:hypothetical protein DFH07DRAFT_780122 [Mycena maculata]
MQRIPGGTSQMAATRPTLLCGARGHCRPHALLAIEEKLGRATEALAASNEKQVEPTQELMVHAEKDMLEAACTEEMHCAQDTIAALEQELHVEGMIAKIYPRWLLSTLAWKKATWAEEHPEMTGERRTRRSSCAGRTQLQTKLEDSASLTSVQPKCNSKPVREFSYWLGIFRTNGKIPGLISDCTSGAPKLVKIHAASRAECAARRHHHAGACQEYSVPHMTKRHHYVLAWFHGKLVRMPHDRKEHKWPGQEICHGMHSLQYDLLRAGLACELERKHHTNGENSVCENVLRSLFGQNRLVTRLAGPNLHSRAVADISHQQNDLRGEDKIKKLPDRDTEIYDQNKMRWSFASADSLDWSPSLSFQ